MNDCPLTPRELREACRLYPAETVLRAVREVCTDVERARGADALVLCYLLTDWLTGETDEDPPPLTPEVASCIWDRLRRSHDALPLR